MLSSFSASSTTTGAAEGKASIVVGVTCCLALAIAWYGNRDVIAEHGARAPTSTNTGFAPVYSTAFAVATNDSEGTKTSSPKPIPNTSTAR